MIKKLLDILKKNLKNILVKIVYIIIVEQVYAYQRKCAIMETAK